MPTITREKKLADTIAGGLDTLDFNYAHAVFAFSRYGSAIHANLFEFILTFLNKWASTYQNGDVEPGDKMYLICQQSSKMVRAL
jgi:hypothetical protein